MLLNPNLIFKDLLWKKNQGIALYWVIFNYLQRKCLIPNYSKKCVKKLMRFCRKRKKIAAFSFQVPLNRINNIFKDL